MQAAPQLVLVSPDQVTAAFARDLRRALQAAPAAAVILRLAAADERAQLAAAKELVGIVQAAGTAALLQGCDDIVGRSGADGVHMLGSSRVGDTVRRFRPEKMVGAGALKSRHDCMTAGEAGADYLLFGDTDALSFDMLLDRVGWWTEIFEIPCTALAPSLDAVPQLVRVGADFVALGDFVWREPDTVGETVRAAASLLEGAVA